MQPKYYGAAASYNRPSSGGLGQILKILAMVIGVIILITIAFFAYSALTSGGKNTAAQMVARQKQLLAFMNANQSYIANPDFKTINSNAISLATSDNYAVTQGLKTFGLSSVPDTISKLEVDTTSSKTLGTAVIQSRFDQVYLQILRDKIASTQQIARTVQSSATGTMKTAVQTLLEHLETIDGQLAKLQL